MKVHYAGKLQFPRLDLFSKVRLVIFSRHYLKMVTVRAKLTGGNQPKSLSGIETDLRISNSCFASSSCNQPKSLSGIETFCGCWGGWGRGPGCNQPKSLSGIETLP